MRGGERAGLIGCLVVLPTVLLLGPSELLAGLGVVLQFVLTWWGARALVDRIGASVPRGADRGGWSGGGRSSPSPGTASQPGPDQRHVKGSMAQPDDSCSSESSGWVVDAGHEGHRSVPAERS